MEIEIVNNSSHRFVDGIANKISKCFNTHPFINNTFALPERIKIVLSIVSIEDCRKTGIDHSSYLKTGIVEIIFNEINLYLEEDLHLPAGNVKSFNNNQVNPDMDKIIYHELGHFIDARLNPAFGYDDNLRPKEDRIKWIHYDIWNGYIDGRLGLIAPSSLEERQKDAEKMNRIEPCYITRAWNGEFATYESITKTAQEINASKWMVPGI
ncbi:MAG: hypothetical protein HZA49_04500 [Planctomycetes bacterium]|nr:hypothetical protein [Planctomycetota bacterium]